MAYRELELTLLSAQDLKSVNLITRMDVYAVVSISGDPLTRQCTAPDTYGGRNPCWDATFRFAVPPTAAAAAGASLHVLLRAERFLGDRDVGEVVVPLSDILAGASGVGPQPPQVASYQVRKLHRWEPRGVLNVSYRLGPVVAPVLERAPYKPPAANLNAYAPVDVPRQPSHHDPSAVAYPAPVGRPAGLVVAEHDEAAQTRKSTAVMAYPVGVPQQQQASHPPAKPDAYRPPPSPPPPPRPAAVHAAKHEAARPPTPTPPPAPAPAPAPAPTRPPTNNNGLGQSGPTHVYMGPHTQIIFSGGAPTTTTTTAWTTSSPTGSIISPAGKKGDRRNWALLPHDTTYASDAESVVSLGSRKEDRWRPSVLSQSHKDTEPQQQQQQAASSPVAAPYSPHRQNSASPFSSRSSSFSSPLSPYSSAHPSPASSAHSSTRSPHSYSPHPSPHSPLRPPAISGAAEVTRGTNNTARGGGAAISASPLPSSSPPMLVPNKHSSVVPSL